MSTETTTAAEKLTNAGFILTQHGLPANPFDVLRRARADKDGLLTMIGETAQRLDRVEEQLVANLSHLQQRAAAAMEALARNEEPRELYSQVLTDVTCQQATRKELVSLLSNMVGLRKSIVEAG
jgi:uncharacterized protein YwgA